MSVDTHTTSGDRVELDGVSKIYQTPSGEVVALEPTSLGIAPGEFVSIVGPSGCGKTTLLQMLAGFLDPTEGVITVAGQQVTGPDPQRGVVFQAPTLYPWLTVRGNVEFGPKVQGVGRAQRRKAADDMLNLVGLQGFGEKRPYELSGGMQQRAQIARVLVNNPSIMLMDEPYGALDDITRQRLQGELLTLWRRERATIVFITHSVDEAVFLSTRVLVMSPRPGRVVVDRRIELPGDSALADDQTRTPDVRATKEFVELKRELSQAIYDAHA